jgi:hypothetical protein
LAHEHAIDRKYSFVVDFTGDYRWSGLVALILFGNEENGCRALSGRGVFGCVVFDRERRLLISGSSVGLTLAAGTLEVGFSRDFEQVLLSVSTDYIFPL